LVTVAPAVCEDFKAELKEFNGERDHVHPTPDQQRARRPATSASSDSVPTSRSAPDQGGRIRREHGNEIVSEGNGQPPERPGPAIRFRIPGLFLAIFGG
jgi:hypothetical protein